MQDSELVYLLTTIRGDDGDHMGILLECSCGSRNFSVWQIHGQTHHHIECVNCHTSYCSGGECSKEDEDGQASRGN